jgi:hypothetical protein
VHVPVRPPISSSSPSQGLHCCRPQAFLVASMPLAPVTTPDSSLSSSPQCLSTLLVTPAPGPLDLSSSIQAATLGSPWAQASRTTAHPAWPAPLCTGHMARLNALPPPPPAHIGVPLSTCARHLSDLLMACLGAEPPCAFPPTFQVQVVGHWAMTAGDPSRSEQAPISPSRTAAGGLPSPIPCPSGAAFP